MQHAMVYKKGWHLTLASIQRKQTKDSMYHIHTPVVGPPSHECPHGIWAQRLDTVEAVNPAHAHTMRQAAAARPIRPMRAMQRHGHGGGVTAVNALRYIMCAVHTGL